MLSLPWKSTNKVDAAEADPINPEKAPSIAHNLVLIVICFIIYDFDNEPVIDFVKAKVIFLKKMCAENLHEFLANKFSSFRNSLQIECAYLLGG